MITIPEVPRPELPFPMWELMPPCGECEACDRATRARQAIRFIDAHFIDQLRRLNVKLPNFARRVDEIAKQREAEVLRIVDGDLPYCDHARVNLVESQVSQ